LLFSDSIYRALKKHQGEEGRTEEGIELLVCLFCMIVCFICFFVCFVGLLVCLLCCLHVCE